MELMKSTYPEVAREDLKVRPGNWDAFDESMFLVFERQHGFVEYDSFVPFSEHAHDALHEILKYC